MEEVSTHKVGLSADHAQKIQELENSAQYQAVLQTIKEQMKTNLHWKMLQRIGMPLVIVAVFVFKLWAIPLLLLVGYFYVWPQYKKRQDLFDNKVRTNDDIYLTDFLSPILKEIFPNATLAVSASFPLAVLKVISPRSSKYNTFTQLAFHDDKELAVCNLYAYHIETHEKKVNGEYQTEEEKVTDFDGQLFSMQLANAFPGHLRIIPTQKSRFLKREIRGDYPGAQKDEVQIETEDIRHNENYNIYCTDEFAARKFLTPKMLEWFDRQIAQNAMCVFLQDNQLYISLYTNRYVFPTPRSQDAIDNLSLVTEYHKLCGELSLIEELTAIFEGESA